jgi:hypothetical protein
VKTATVLASFATLVAACGYTTGSGMRELGVRTVAVAVVGNDTFRQRLEVELGQALARELPATHDVMLADARSADAVLQVRIVDAIERTLVSGERGDPVREGAFRAGVWMRLVHRDGRVVIDRQIADRTEFRTPIGEDLTSARAELVEDLARKIVIALETPF